MQSTPSVGGARVTRLESRAPERFVAIGEVRRRTGMTNRAIRFYEDRGLIESRRDARGQRLYGAAAMDRLVYVAHARRAGLAIADIRRLLDILDHQGEAELAAHTEEFYRARLSALEAQRSALEASAAALGLDLRPPRPQAMAI